MTAPAPLDPVLRHLRGEPSRTWSIVVTVFGDAVAPRGGSVWLGTLLAIFAGMGIGGGVIRTAMSRLTADGWVRRTRAGRNSFYTPTEKGRASFAEGAARIYGRPPEGWSGGWSGRFHLLLPADGADRDALRPVLERGGFGAAAPGVWIAPPSTPVPEGAAVLRLDAGADAGTARLLAERAWPLSRTAEAYRRFLDAFAPLRDWAGGLSDLDAVVARTLLIHEYRRVVLRDPRLPPELLPEGWPGAEARRLCAGLYAALLPGSERWLDENGRDEHGPLPPPASDLRRRFEGV